MQTEDSLLTGDRARRRKLIKELRTSRRRKARRQMLRDVTPDVIYISLMVLLLAVVFFGTRAIDRWLDTLIAETAYVAEASEIEVVEVEKPAQEVPEQNNEVVLATVTAYTSSVDETDDTPFITASGARTGDGIIACPPKYEFGTQVEIEGKTFTCEDRMNRRYHQEERFDMWVETKAEAFQWGVRQLPVEIVALR